MMKVLKEFASQARKQSEQLSRIDFASHQAGSRMPDEFAESAMVIGRILMVMMSHLFSRHDFLLGNWKGRVLKLCRIPAMFSTKQTGSARYYRYLDLDIFNVSGHAAGCQAPKGR
jgi:hypothetical protein